MANRSKKSFLTGAALLLVPALAQAHTLPGGGQGLAAGFNHPWQGWDHLWVMLAVGVWAAQQGGRAMWRLPLVFVSVMTLGGIAGAAGVQLPGVEFLVLLSVPVFGWMILERAKLQSLPSLALVGFFAFFHGLAHGMEMPVSASLFSFAVGFVLATFLLHGLGLVVARVAMVGLSCTLSNTAFAQENTNAPAVKALPDAPPESPLRLGEIVVEGRADSLLEIADSATEGTVGQQQLEERPRFRVGEILETVPGVITTQHAGGGKANQYFLRGFNLDHGTDFYTSLDGMPLNLPSHGHGQGYSDMNIVIAELVQRVDYQKGPYYAVNGDFSSAGAAHLDFYQTLPQTIAIAEGGMYGFARSVFAASPAVGSGNLLYGFEYQHSDGPWAVSDDYNKFNGLLTYSQGNAAIGFSVTARAYYGQWNSSDQVAASAVEDGLIPLYGSLDETTGGNSQRYSLQGEWHRASAESATKVMAYGFYYDLDLFSNFTYFLTDTNRGDQFEQSDRRWTAGLVSSHTLFNHWGNRDVENTFGLQVRNDAIQNGLYNTVARQRVDKTNSFDGTLLNATTRQDDILETSVGLYYENKVQWTEKFRSVAALRGDVFNFNVASVLPENSGDQAAVIGSPKFSLIFGPWAKTEIYVQGGLGFHSNDGRGVTTHVDPITGEPVAPAKPLVQTYGAEVGVRTLYAPGLQSTLSVWWLDIDSELLFVGDAGSTEASRPSRRYGVEWANYYTPTKWLTFDADFSFSYAHFRDYAPEVDYIPGSVGNVIAVGVTVHDLQGFFGSVRLRYFGPRPLTEDASIESAATALLSAQIGYQFNKTWTVTADVFNLLNNTAHDIDYYYDSRVRPGDQVVGQIHFHPVEPIQARIALTARF